MKRPITALVLTTLLLGASSSRAQQAADKASAEALFDQGRKLMAAGNSADACPKFEASQKLDPGVGTMLNLADCYEKVGRTASAWAEFREAIPAAHDAGSADREQIARARAKDLESRLSYLTVVAWKGQTVVVTRDGETLDAQLMGTAIPVDPGSHIVVATAPGKREWSTRVNVGAGGARVSVSVPILPDESKDGNTGAGALVATREDGGSTANPGGTARTLAITAGAVGVVGLAAGTIFGLKASSEWNDAKSNCHPYPYCGQDGAQHADDARGHATLATIGFVVGVAGLATGAVLWFTAPKAESEASTSVGMGLGNIVVRGRF
jgi:hypothetical protein